MGAEAVRRPHGATRPAARRVDALIVATTTPDMVFPATACLIQDRLGLKQTWGFDLSAACSGFLYALTSGAQFIASGAHRRVIVVGADLMSAIIDPLDRTTAVLFGDGAGAVVLEPAEPGFGLLDFHHRVDGSGRNDLYMAAGGSLRPASHETVDGREHYLRQNGRVVFKFAVSQMAGCIEILLERNGLKPSDLAMVIPHQANQRILDATAERLGLPARDRMASVVARYGNTTAATIPLALDDALAQRSDPARGSDRAGGRWRGVHRGGDADAVAVTGPTSSKTPPHRSPPGPRRRAAVPARRHCPGRAPRVVALGIGITVGDLLSTQASTMACAEAPRRTAIGARTGCVGQLEIEPPATRRAVGEEPDALAERSARRPRSEIASRKNGFSRF